jgi:hypothetical protein
MKSRTLFGVACCLGATWVAVASGCLSGEEPPPVKAGSTTSAVTSPLWVLEEYPNGCADQCGAPNCNCVGNRCSASLAGQPCGPVGASCNVVNTNYYQEMVCEQPPPPPPTTWTRIATESCRDVCGIGNCNCVKKRCVANPEGQPCPTVGATCNAISGLYFAELTCQ